jgi:hydrogenase small subunit
VTKVRIIDQGDTTGISADNATCTEYVDDIWIAGISYADRSASIFLYPGVGATGVGFVLAVEGSVVTGKPAGLGASYAGEFCEVGPMVPGTGPGGDETMLNAFLTYARQASAVLAIGTCASYGGIPKLNTTDKTNCKGCAQVLKENGIKTPVINVPGCPAHPDWIVGTIVAFIARGLDGIDLDSKGRPRDYYGGYVCNGNQGNIAQSQDVACPWRYNAGPTTNGPVTTGESRGLAKYKWGSIPNGTTETYGDETSGDVTYPNGHTFEGCLGVLGCRGRKTHADCAYRKWNANTNLTPGTLGVNWCVGSRGGCQGCTEPDFPMLKRFYTFV